MINKIDRMYVFYENMIERQASSVHNSLVYAHLGKRLYSVKHYVPGRGPVVLRKPTIRYAGSNMNSPVCNAGYRLDRTSLYPTREDGLNKPIETQSHNGIKAKN